MNTLLVQMVRCMVIKMYPTKAEIEFRKKIIRKEIEALEKELKELEGDLKRLHYEEWLLQNIENFQKGEYYKG